MVFHISKSSMSGNLSVQRAVTILEYLACAETPQGLGELSLGLDMHKSTVHRFLSTLVDAGYVRQDVATGRYALGARAAWLGAKFLESMDIRKVARPILEELAQATRETIHLGIMDRHEVVYVDKVAGPQTVQMRSQVGSRMPAHCTALGKILLADLPEPAWERYVSEVGLTPQTPNTIADPGTFYDHLRQVCCQNYSIDDVENEEGIRCVAAPVRDHVGRVVAAVSVTGSTLTMTPEKAQAMIPVVQRAALEVSEGLGFQTEEVGASQGGEAR
jgi:DNA-binding IclR family transcriptional regulator